MKMMTKIHILLTFLICGCAPALAQPRAVSVNPSERFQTIDNFTASDAWSGEFVGRYWKAMEVKGDHALIALWPEDGDLHNGGRATANKLLWALGNYSFFIRPGYVRVACDGADDLNALAVSAYISPEGDRLVLVGVNSGFEDGRISLNLPSSLMEKVTDMKIYRTDSRTDLALVASSARIPMTVTAKQRSITTIVVDLQ